MLFSSTVGNEASHGGGIAAWNDSGVFIRDSTFYRNGAEIIAGAISSFDHSTVYASNLTFSSKLPFDFRSSVIEFCREYGKVWWSHGC